MTTTKRAKKRDQLFRLNEIVQFIALKTSNPFTITLISVIILKTMHLGVTKHFVLKT